MSNIIGKKYIYILLTLFVSSFLIVPFFGDVDKSAKIYLIILFISFSLCLCLKRGGDVIWSRYFSILFVLVFLISVSSLFSSHPVWSLSATAILIFAILSSYFTSYLAVSESGFFRAFNATILIIGVCVASLGLYEFICFVLNGPSRGMLIPYLMPPDSTIRVGGIYGQPNLFSVLLTVVIICFFYWHLTVGNRIRNLYIEIFKYLPFVLVCYVFFLTQSKGGLLSLLLTLLVFLWLLISNRFLPQQQDYRRVICSLVFGVFLSYVLYRISFGFISTDLRNMDVAGVGTSIRYLLWMNSVLIFIDNPFLGIGLDNFRFVQSLYNVKSHDCLGFVPYEAMGSTPWVHNEILQVLCETGVPITLLIILFFVLLLRGFLGKLRQKRYKMDFNFLFSHLILLPFIFQSLLSWPLRHPALLFLFFVILGFVLSYHHVRTIRLGNFLSIALRALLMSSLALAVVLMVFEVQVGRLKSEIISADQIELTINDFEKLVVNPYSKYRILRNALPVYVREALAAEDTKLATWALPYCEEITTIEGARWQWYNLARIYLKVGDEKGSRIAIQKAIDLRPSDDITWAFLHYLNMLEASRKTGRPLEAFLPLGQKIDMSQLELSGD